MRELRLRACLPLTMACFAACEIVREPTPFEVDEDAVSVHAMLVAGERRITVLITRFDHAGPGANPPDGNLRLVGVSGAEVHVAGAGQSLTLAGDQPAEACIHYFFSYDDRFPLSAGCYAADVDAGIVAGTAYVLKIALSRGGIVTGSAEVPAPITIRSPQAGTTLEVAERPWDEQPLQPFPLAWDNPGADRPVHLGLEVHHPDCGQGIPRVPFFGQFIDLTGRDTADVGHWAVLCTLAPASNELRGTFNLVAFDLTYANYLEEFTGGGPALDRPRASFGLTGASGIVAGGAVTRLPVRILIR